MSRLLLWATEVQFHLRLLGVGTVTFTQVKKPWCSHLWLAEDCLGEERTTSLDQACSSTFPVRESSHTVLEVKAVSMYNTESNKMTWASAISISNLTFLASTKYIEMYIPWLQCHDQLSIAHPSQDIASTTFSSLFGVVKNFPWAGFVLHYKHILCHFFSIVILRLHLVDAYFFSLSLYRKFIENIFCTPCL